MALRLQSWPVCRIAVIRRAKAVLTELESTMPKIELHADEAAGTRKTFRMSIDA